MTVYSLTEIQHEGSLDTHPIARLFRGHPIVLQVTDLKMRKKKRLPKPRLFLCPMNLYGGDVKEILISLEGGGAEVMELARLEKAKLYLMGLTLKSARVLIDEIECQLNDIRG